MAYDAAPASHDVASKHRSAQLSETFLSSKHQEFLAAIAEFISAKRA